MSAESHLTNHDYELLSAYLDGELTDAERSALETRLEADHVLHQELEALRQTVGLLQQLPTLKAPRDFVLDVQMLGEATRSPAAPRVVPLQQLRRQPFYLRPSLWTAAAALILVVLSGVVIMTLSGPQIGSVFENVASSLSDSAGTPVANVPTAVAPTPMPSPPAETFDTMDADTARTEISAPVTIAAVAEGNTDAASTGIITEDDTTSRMRDTSEAEDAYRSGDVVTSVPDMQDGEQTAESTLSQLMAPAANEPQPTEMPMAAMVPPASPTNEGLLGEVGGAGGAPPVTGALEDDGAADTPLGEPADAAEKAASPEMLYAAPSVDTVAQQPTATNNDLLIAPTATAAANAIEEQTQSADEIQESQLSAPGAGAALPQTAMIVIIGALIVASLFIVMQG